MVYHKRVLKHFDDSDCCSLNGASQQALHQGSKAGNQIGQKGFETFYIWFCQLEFFPFLLRMFQNPFNAS